MKNIYNAPNKEVAAAELDNLEKKWGGKYPYAILSWRNKWDDLTVFFQFPLEIRKIIYTTNLIENLNGKIRKYTKSKLSSPSDDAVKKAVYLSLMEIEKKWTMPISNWGLIMNQFILMFKTRIPDIKTALQLNPVSIYTEFWTVPILENYLLFAVFKCPPTYAM